MLRGIMDLFEVTYLCKYHFFGGAKSPLFLQSYENTCEAKKGILVLGIFVSNINVCSLDAALLLKSDVEKHMSC
jgi:hypothetical protein